MSGGAKHITEAVVFKNAGRAAVVQNQKLLQLFSHGGNCQTVTRAYITHHHIHLVTLVQIAQFLHLLGGASGFVHVNDLDGQAANTGFVIGCGRLAFVKSLHQDLGAIDRRNAKALSSLARQKTDDANFESFLGKGALGQQGQHRGGEGAASKGGDHGCLLQGEQG